MHMEKFYNSNTQSKVLKTFLPKIAIQIKSSRPDHTKEVQKPLKKITFKKFQVTQRCKTFVLRIVNLNVEAVGLFVQNQIKSFICEFRL